MSSQTYKVMGLILLVACLSACASQSRFNDASVTSHLLPRDVTENPENTLGETVKWGGRILAVDNLSATTELEVLGFPLTVSGQIDTSHESTGRFIVIYSGFLEPSSYSVDKLIGIVGEIVASRDADIGNATYHYPVLHVQLLKLAKEKRKWSFPLFSIGIGFEL